MSKHYFIFVFVLLCLALSGCGNGFVPVQGKVTFEDGSPLTQGGIAFSTATFMADGKIRADGSFTLTSSKPGDGLPPGNYIVTISASETDDKERTIYLVDPKFGDVTTSPFTAEVSADQKKFDFTVSKPK